MVGVWGRSAEAGSGPAEAGSGPGPPCPCSSGACRCERSSGRQAALEARGWREERAGPQVRSSLQVGGLADSRGQVDTPIHRALEGQARAQPPPPLEHSGLVLEARGSLAGWERPGGSWASGTV